MNLIDFKQATTGMDLKRELGFQTSEQLLPLRIVGRDGDLLLLDTNVDVPATLGDLVALSNAALTLRVRHHQTIYPVYGYRIVASIIVLG